MLKISRASIRNNNNNNRSAHAFYPAFPFTSNACAKTPNKHTKIRVSKIYHFEVKYSNMNSHSLRNETSKSGRAATALDFINRWHSNTQCRISIKLPIENFSMLFGELAIFLLVFFFFFFFFLDKLWHFLLLLLPLTEALSPFGERPSSCKHWHRDAQFSIRLSMCLYSIEMRMRMKTK